MHPYASTLRYVYESPEGLRLGLRVDLQLLSCDAPTQCVQTTAPRVALIQLHKFRLKRCAVAVQRFRIAWYSNRN
jgi:hypothetical protein